MTSYECEKHGPYHKPSFIAKAKFEDKYGRYEQYEYNANIKKEAANEAVLRVVRDLQNFYLIVIKDVSKG